MRVAFTRRATRQIDVVLAYVANDSPRASADILDEVEARAALLGEHPGLGRPTSMPGVRMFPVPRLPDLIFFRERREDVQIVGIRDGRRRPLS